MARKTTRAESADRIEIESGSGNVFEDLGLSDPAERLARQSSRE